MLAALALFALGDAAYLWDDAHGGHAPQGPGLRIGLSPLSTSFAEVRVGLDAVEELLRARL